MRKVMMICVVLIFAFASVSIAAEGDVRSPLRTYELSISDTTTARDQTATYSGISWFAVNNGPDYIDLQAQGPNLGIFSVQVTDITLAGSNANNVTLTNANSSGATYWLVYTISNKSTIWAGNGVTKICGPIQLSGATPVVQTFPSGTPEFARYMKIGVLTGMTQYQAFKATLAVQ